MTEEINTTLLLEKWQDGDRPALDKLIETHLPWIRNRVHKRLGPALRVKAETGDIVQDTVIELLTYAPRFRIASGKLFRGLVAQMVENVLRGKHAWFTAKRRAASRERQANRDTILYLDAPVRDVTRPSMAVHRQEQENWVRLGIEMMTPTDREVVVFRQWEQLPFDEIAEKLDITTEAAKKRYQRSLGRLSEIIGALRRGEIAALLPEDDERGE